MEKEVNKILERLSMEVISLDEARAEMRILGLFNVSVLLFDFLYYVRNGTQDTPIKEIKDGIRTFLANYKR